jgi:hypothetical protein
VAARDAAAQDGARQAKARWENHVSVGNTEELANGRKGYLSRRILNWSQDGHRRFWVIARKNYAYGWQMGRFDGDVEFWRSKLGGDDADIAVVGRHDNRVRFRLRKADQITAFREAINGPLAKLPFLKTAVGGDDGDADGDAENEDANDA